MTRYLVEITEKAGNTEPIDNITAPDGYTAEQYICDCEDNADLEWIEMLHNAIEVILVPLED